MHRAEFVEEVSRRHQVDAATVAAVLGAIEDTLEDVVRQGETVVLRGFGVFEPRESRTAGIHHPETGELLEVPERRRFWFRASDELNRRLNT